MLFSSLTFLLRFLPITLAAYYLVPQRLKNAVLLIASLFFYAWGEPVYIILMILSILFNYVSGLDIGRKLEAGESAKAALVAAVAVDLAMLGIFKYYAFFLDMLNVIPFVKISYPELGLPIGISFYTFQAISYLADVYRKDAQPQKNIINFGLYISMFPQLIAGPIVRYSDIEAQMESRKCSLGAFGQGAQFFIIGLAKKVILANGIGALHDTVLAQVSAGEASAAVAWIGAIAYTLQIYFDFSGYSDMAIGLGHMFGFKYLKNFDYPYLSASVTEFWRRWHMSLGTWFREYVYIPLGGNRVSIRRHILNLLIVWGLTGLWHGASWNFVFWGLYYGAFLIFEKYVLNKIYDRIPGVVRHLYTLFIVVIGWVFFFSDSMGDALLYLANMIGIGAAGLFSAEALYLLNSYRLILLLGVICSTKLPFRLFRSLGRRNVGSIIRIILLVLVFALAIACLITDSFNPFLYFRF